MRTCTVILTTVVFLTTGFGLAQDYQHFYNEAKKALGEKHYQEFYTLIKKAYELHPYHQTILWNVGVAAALNSKPDEAIEFLTKAININAGYDLDDPHLDAIRNHPGFRHVMQTKTALNTMLIHSDTAVTLTDRQLHLESVAIDPSDGSFFGGSIYKRKIIKINSRGVASDFTSPEQYNMGGVFGLKVDSKKRFLWACSSPIPEMQHYDSTVASTLFQFDLKTGRLSNSYLPADTLKNHIFGDLALDSTGIPYVSDSRNNVIYKLDGSANKLLPYFSSNEFWNIQGIAFSDNDALLYIADYIKGIFILDMATKHLSKVKIPYDLSLKGADGILFYRNSLITIQNGVQPNRVARHYFDPTGRDFIRYEIIDNGHPAFGEPTIGSLSGNVMFYIANSQWSGYQDGTIKPASELHPIVILKYVLTKEL